MDGREAIQKIEAIIDNGQDYGYWTDAQRKALDLAIEALEREIEYGQMVVDFTKGETMTPDEWKYDTTKLAPSVTPTERTGEWIEHDPKTKGLAKIYECPFCDDEVIGEKTNYCPNCGAKMG